MHDSSNSDASVNMTVIRCVFEDGMRYKLKDLLEDMLMSLTEQQKTQLTNSVTEQQRDDFYRLFCGNKQLYQLLSSEQQLDLYVSLSSEQRLDLYVSLSSEQRLDLHQSLSRELRRDLFASLSKKVSDAM